MNKCTQDGCNEEGTELRRRGDEKFFYCKPHAQWWDKIMENCF